MHQATACVRRVLPLSVPGRGGRSNGHLVGGGLLEVALFAVQIPKVQLLNSKMGRLIHRFRHPLRLARRNEIG